MAISHGELLVSHNQAGYFFGGFASQGADYWRLFMIELYPLVICCIAMENPPIFNGKIHYFYGQLFNSKLLNYQRVRFHIASPGILALPKARASMAGHSKKAWEPSEMSLGNLPRTL